MTVRFINGLTRRVYDYELEELDDSRKFYHFKIELQEGMPDGEYTLQVWNGDSLLTDTICQIGDYVSNNNVYTKEENGYKQYNG